MKKYLFLVVLTLSGALTGCSLEKVPAGNVGIIVNLYGSDKGVNEREVGVGRYWLNWNEELYLFPTFDQNYVWTREPVDGDNTDESITFGASNGTSLNADVSITYNIPADKAYLVFQKYRRGVDEITDRFLRNIVKDAMIEHASSMTVEQIYGPQKVEFMNKVEESVRTFVAPFGINVTKISLASNFRVPDNVKQAMDAAVAATQKAQERENQLREAEAQAKIDVTKAEGQAKARLAAAEADAKANELISKSLTPQLVQMKWIETWNGALPQVQTGNGGVLLNMSSLGGTSAK